MNCQSPSGIRMERGTRDGGFGGGQDCSFPCLSRWPSGWITRGALMVHGLLRHEISASHTSSLKGSTQGGRSGTGEGRERRGGGEKSFSSPIWVNKYFIQPGRQKKSMMKTTKRRMIIVMMKKKSKKKKRQRRGPPGRLVQFASVGNLSAGRFVLRGQEDKWHQCLPCIGLHSQARDWTAETLLSPKTPTREAYRVDKRHREKER